MYPSPIFQVAAGDQVYRIVLPQVLSVVSGVDFVDQRQVPVVVISGVGVRVVCTSPEHRESVAGAVGGALEQWHLFSVMGPVLWSQIMSSPEGDSPGDSSV